MTSSRLAYDAHDLSLLLAERIAEVVDALGIDVRHHGRRTLECFAPWEAHHRPKLVVELWPTPGKWNDWIGGKWGDALDLVACTLGGGDKDRSAAYRWALEFLGLKGQSGGDEWERRRAEAQQSAARRAAEAAQQLDRMRKNAHAWWLNARPIERGDVAWRYLEARGVDLGQLPRQPRALRLGLTERWHDKSGHTAHIGPAICAAMSQASSEFGSLHRTWINPDRPGEKAELDPPRKMWPDSSGCVIRLWRGASNLSERQAAEKGLKEPVIVCEGVEDGLSIALMAPEYRVLAAGSLPGLTAFTPPACAERIIVAADNDWGKPQAAQLLERACRRLAGEFALPVAIARSPQGKDFNDLLKGA